MKLPNAYQHTQRGPWFVVLFLLSMLFIGLSVNLADFELRFVFLPVGVLLGVLAAGMHHLSVVSAGDHLLIQFGPLPIFRRRIFYSDISSVELGRTILLDGWGIHWSIRGGWVWNIWGRSCVVIRFRNRKLFLGTNDGERLLNHLRRQVSDFGGARDLIADRGDA